MGLETGAWEWVITGEMGPLVTGGWVYFWPVVTAYVHQVSKSYGLKIERGKVAAPLKLLKELFWKREQLRT